MGRTSGAAVRIFQITYIVGFFLGCLLHLVVNKIFPPAGLGIAEPFDGADGHDATVIEGLSASSDDGNHESKKPVTSEIKVAE